MTQHCRYQLPTRLTAHNMAPALTCHMCAVTIAVKAIAVITCEVHASHHVKVLVGDVTACVNETHHHLFCTGGLDHGPARPHVATGAVDRTNTHKVGCGLCRMRHAGCSRECARVWRQMFHRSGVHWRYGGQGLQDADKAWGPKFKGQAAVRADQ
jgi:hypothetical protein